MMISCLSSLELRCGCRQFDSRFPGCYRLGSARGMPTGRHVHIKSRSDKRGYKDDSTAMRTSLRWERLFRSPTLAFQAFAMTSLGGTLVLTFERAEGGTGATKTGGVKHACCHAGQTDEACEGPVCLFARPPHTDLTWAKGDKGLVERAPSSVVRLKPAVKSLTRRYRIEHRGFR